MQPNVWTGGIVLKKFLSIVLAVVMTAAMSLTGFAASIETLGSTDFASDIIARGSKVSKTVKDRKNTYRINGIYYSSLGKESFKLLNRERRAEGLKELVWVDELVQPAIQRALEQYLFYNQDPPLSHSRPDGTSWSTVSKLANGENLAGGQVDAEEVSVGWMNSTGHRENILDSDFTGGAIVCVETDQMIYWCELFTAKKIDSITSDDASSDTSSEDNGSNVGKTLVNNLTKAKTSAATTTTTVKNIDKIPVDALKAAANWGTTNKKTVFISVDTLSTSGKSVLGRITLNPANFIKNKNALNTGVFTEKSSTADAAAKIKKAYPKAKYAVMTFGQSGNYGGSVSITAKLELTGLNSQKLIFYSFDSKTGKATKMDLGKAGYTIDKNGYLRFATTKGGIIFVTDKAL